MSGDEIAVWWRLLPNCGKIASVSPGQAASDLTSWEWITFADGESVTKRKIDIADAICWRQVSPKEQDLQRKPYPAGPIVSVICWSLASRAFR